MKFKSVNTVKLKKKTANGFIAVFRWLFLISVGYIVLFPILSSISTAIKQDMAFYDVSLYWIPRYVTFENFEIAFNTMNYSNSILRTVTLELVSAGIEIVTCAIVAYGFARFNFKFKKVFEFLLMATIVIPTQIYIVSMVIGFKSFDFLGILGFFNQITSD